MTPTVHPRVCGEHAWSAAATPAGSGSSPRVRGTPASAHSATDRRRFIPACAGNTPTSGRLGYYDTVHPRVCGEHPVSVPRFDPSRGSSPRVRGTQGRVEGRAHRGRFIPACAGNTRQPRPRRAPRPVHPRVCGEHGSLFQVVGTDNGSSPRVRGTQENVPRQNPLGRFIPACAGNTQQGANSHLAMSVHPRVCGEHPWLIVDFKLDDGSSPRVRGTRQDRGQRHAQRRFIPACAGNTPSSS